MWKFMRLGTAFLVCAVMATSGAFGQRGGGHGGGGHGGSGGHGGGGHRGGGGGHIGGGHIGGGGSSFRSGRMSSGHAGGRSMSAPRSRGGGMSVPRSGSSFNSPSNRGGTNVPRSSGSLGSRGQRSTQFSNGSSGTSHGHVGNGQIRSSQHNNGLNLGQRHVGSSDRTGHASGRPSSGGPNGPSNRQSGGNGPHQTAAVDGGRHQGGQFGNRSGGNWDGNHHGGGNWDGNHHGRNNGGWNGHYHNNYRTWHHGFWPIGFWGFNPWWGGYGRGFGPGYGYGGWGYGGYGLRGSGWGYPSLLYNSGYYSYYNPYCTGPLVLGSTVIDYSQPVTVANQATVDDSATAAAMAEFDNARAAFKHGDYDAAMEGVDRALQQIPDDGVLHEFRALVLFARGDYRAAASAIHSVLAGGPGWDWETLRSLYPDVGTYTVQLRALEAYARDNPSSADARFLMAYHYLSCGYTDASLEQLQRVVALQPDDTVARELIRSMSPETETPPPAPPAAGPSLPEVAPAAAPGATEDPGLPPAPPETVRAGAQPAAADTLADTLIGAWNATRDDGSTFSLSLDKDGSFRWDYSGNGESNALTGMYTLANDLLVLEPESGGAMVGRVTGAADGQFHFQLVGGPPGDQGLTFQK